MATMTSIMVMPRAPASRTRASSMAHPWAPRSAAGARRSPSCPCRPRRAPPVAEARPRRPCAASKPARDGLVTYCMSVKSRSIAPSFQCTIDGDAADGRLEHRLERRVDEREHHREQPLRAGAAEATAAATARCSAGPRRSRARAPPSRVDEHRADAGRRARWPDAGDEPMPASRPRPPPRSDDEPGVAAERRRLGQLDALDLPVAGEARRPPCRRSRRARVLLFDLRDSRA